MSGATTLASERRGHTLDLLLVSGARPRDIVLGHLRAAWARSALVVTVIAPVLLVPPPDPRLDLACFALAAAVPYLILVPAIAFGMALSARLGTRSATALAVLGAAGGLAAVVLAWGSPDPLGWWSWTLWLLHPYAATDPVHLGVVPAAFYCGGTALLVALSVEPLVRRRDRGKAVGRVALALMIVAPVVVGLQVGVAPDRYGALYRAGRVLLVTNALILAWALLAKRPSSGFAAVPIVLGAVVLGVMKVRWETWPDGALGHVAASTVTASALVLFVSGVRALLGRWTGGYGERVAVVALLGLIALVPLSVVDVTVDGAPALVAWLDRLSPVRPLLPARTWTPPPPLGSLPPFVALYGLVGLGLRPFAKPRRPVTVPRGKLSAAPAVGYRGGQSPAGGAKG